MTRATMWSTRTSAISAWPAFRPARPAASTTGAACRARRAYSVEAQFGWDALPAELSAEELAAAGASADRACGRAALQVCARRGEARSGVRRQRLCRRRPAVVGRAPVSPIFTDRRRRTRSVPATVVGNVRVTEVGREYDTHHIVLDFGAVPFPVLEGQSIGIIPPGTDAEDGRTTRASIRSRARATASGPATTTSRSP